MNTSQNILYPVFNFHYLFFRPSQYFRNQEGFRSRIVLLLAVWIMGIVLVIDKIEDKIALDRISPSLQAVLSSGWLYFWLIAAVLGIISGAFFGLWGDGGLICVLNGVVYKL